MGSTGSVTAADFNGDGRVDIAAPSYNGNTVVTYLERRQRLHGRGSRQRHRRDTARHRRGRLQPRRAAGPRHHQPQRRLGHRAPAQATNSGFASEAAAIPVGASPEGIEAADFNGDGLPDIAVAVLGTNTVNVLLRNPGGGFTAEAPIPVGAGALGLATADFDADGRPDLAVTSNTAGTVTVLLRQAGGGFAADGAPLAVTRANGVAAGDFNGDGKPDLAASNDQANTLSVFLNTTAPAPRRRSPQGRPPPPVPGKSAVVRVVSGKVLIKLPGKGFVPLTAAANIPMGSQLDTRKGRVDADDGGRYGRQEDAEGATSTTGSSRSSRPCPRRSPRRPGR